MTGCRFRRFGRVLASSQPKDVDSCTDSTGGSAGNHHCLIGHAMSSVFPDFIHLNVDGIDAIVVGDGCFRRDLPARDGVRVWVVDMAPGAIWPKVDDHDEYGEDIFVVSGELIEGERRLAAGSFLSF